MLGCHTFFSSISLSAIFQPLLNISLQVFASTPSNLPILSNLYFFDKIYFHHLINPIHPSGSFYIFHGILLFCSIFFSSVQFMIECGYQSVSVSAYSTLITTPFLHEKLSLRTLFSVGLLILIIYN